MAAPSLTRKRGTSGMAVTRRTDCECKSLHFSIERVRRRPGGSRRPPWTGTCDSASSRRYSYPVHHGPNPPLFLQEERSYPMTTASCPTRCGPIFAYRHWPSKSRTLPCSMLVDGQERRCVWLAPDTCARDAEPVFAVDPVSSAMVKCRGEPIRRKPAQQSS